MQQKPDYDQIVKLSAITDPQGFLNVFARGLKLYTTRSEELPSQARRADEVWEVVFFDGQHGILHIEFQTEVEDNIGLRVAEYALRLFRHYKLPVHSVVIFLRPAKNVPTSPFGWDWNTQEELRYHYESIRLWELSAEQLLETPFYDIWPFAALMHRKVTLAYEMALAKRIAQAPIEREHLGDIMQRLGILAGIRLSKSDSDKLRERINAMMGEEILKESTYIQVLIEKWQPEILAKREAEGMHKMTRVALEGRFGTLSDDLLAALETADQETLEGVVAHISTDTLEQTRARLGLK
ncbi:MAG TPA: hypothetical protein VH599_02705 [Ktedonobacterales bacterium]|jgi:predicted transposase YdaD